MGVPPLQPLYHPSTFMLPQRSLLHLLPCRAGQLPQPASMVRHYAILSKFSFASCCRPPVFVGAAT